VNFNYTTTLEGTYVVNQSKILYLHGVVYSPSAILFGCPQGSSSDFSHDPHSDAVLDIVLQQEGVDLISELEKVPRLNLLERFLSKTPLERVTTIGFSFSRADQPYISVIADHCTAQTIWHQYNYKPDDSDKCDASLQLAKFPGHVKHHRMNELFNYIGPGLPELDPELS